MDERDWQSIETAPKDGTEILVSIGGDSRVVHWYGGLNMRQKAYPWVCQSGQNAWRSSAATHWMPLPNPPSKDTPA